MSAITVQTFRRGRGLRPALRRHGRAFLIAGLLALALIGLNFALLARVGELAAPATIAARQQAEGAFYGGLRHPLAAVKLAAMRARAAEIVVFGTSRALQIRADAFTAPFYNLGGLANGPAQALMLWRHAVAAHKPRLVVLVADWWAYGDPPRVASRVRPPLPVPFDGQRAGGRADVLLWQLLLSERLSSAAAWSALIAPAAHGIGINAAHSGAGFRPDGSLCMDGPRPPASWRPRLIATGPALRPSHYRPDLAVSASAMATLDVLLHEIADAGAEVLILAPPIAPAAHALLSGDPRFAWIGDWRREMAARHRARFVDAHDPAPLAAPDFEFYDDVHPGETGMLRVLRRALRVRPDLARVLDAGAIERGIADGAGRITVPAFAAVPCPADKP